MVSQSGSPFLLLSACFQRGPLAPSALPDFPATTGLSDSRHGPLAVIYSRWRLQRVATLLPCRVSQVPWLICPCALHPLTPGSPATAFTHCFIAGFRLHLIWQAGHFLSCNEAETVLLALRLTGSPFGAPSKRIAPLHARLATCRMGNLHGEFLSSHKISQASPGAPDEHG